MIKKPEFLFDKARNLRSAQQLRSQSPGAKKNYLNDLKSSNQFEEIQQFENLSDSKQKAFQVRKLNLKSPFQRDCVSAQNIREQKGYRINSKIQISRFIQEDDQQHYIYRLEKNKRVEKDKDQQEDQIKEKRKEMIFLKNGTNFELIEVQDEQFFQINSKNRVFPLILEIMIQEGEMQLEVNRNQFYLQEGKSEFSFKDFSKNVVIDYLGLNKISAIYLRVKSLEKGRKVLFYFRFRFQSGLEANDQILVRKIKFNRIREKGIEVKQSFDLLQNGSIDLKPQSAPQNGVQIFFGGASQVDEKIKKVQLKRNLLEIKRENDQQLKLISKFSDKKIGNDKSRIQNELAILNQTFTQNWITFLSSAIIFDGIYQKFNLIRKNKFVLARQRRLLRDQFYFFRKELNKKGESEKIRLNFDSILSMKIKVFLKKKLIKKQCEKLFIRVMRQGSQIRILQDRMKALRHKIIIIQVQYRESKQILDQQFQQIQTHFLYSLNEMCQEEKYFLERHWINQNIIQSRKTKIEERWKRIIKEHFLEIYDEYLRQLKMYFLRRKRLSNASKIQFLFIQHLWNLVATSKQQQHVFNNFKKNQQNNPKILHFNYIYSFNFYKNSEIYKIIVDPALKDLEYQKFIKMNPNFFEKIQESTKNNKNKKKINKKPVKLDDEQIKNEEKWDGFFYKPYPFIYLYNFEIKQKIMALVSSLIHK